MNIEGKIRIFRVEEKFAGGKFRGRKISRELNFAGGKFREIPLAVDIIFAGGKFRAKSKFAKIAKLNSTRKIGVIQYAHKHTHMARRFHIYSLN